MNVKYRTPGFVAAALLGSALFLAVDGVTGVAWADRCGKSSRMTLPDCVDSWYKGSSYRVTNNCGFRIVLKINVKHARDMRFSLDPGDGQAGTAGYVWSKIRNIRCCPRYSQCTPNTPG